MPAVRAGQSADLGDGGVVLGVCALSMRREVLQELWSGYGVIERVWTPDGPVIEKRVQPPDTCAHPRGWASSVGHARKLRSYAVEHTFYASYAESCGVRTAAAHHLERTSTGWRFVFEDLDAAGFPHRRRTSERAVRQVVRSLAAFHRAFLGASGDGLWERGTYWHLATRPEEHAAMAPGPLKDAAGALDAALRGCPLQTLVHGDAKLANVCFADDDAVAWVDFQYAGRGVGLSDLAYFLGSVFDDDALHVEAPRWLEVYFTALDHEEAEAAWRPLWPAVWADFERFLAGWAPGHRKRGGFSAGMTARAVSALRR